MSSSGGYSICDVCGTDSRSAAAAGTLQPETTRPSFHTFSTKNRQKRQLWSAACTNAGCVLPLKKSIVICSKHFSSEDFYFHGNKRRLLDSAVPFSKTQQSQDVPSSDDAPVNNDVQEDPNLNSGEAALLFSTPKEDLLPRTENVSPPSSTPLTLGDQQISDGAARRKLFQENSSDLPNPAHVVGSPKELRDNETADAPLLFADYMEADFQTEDRSVAETVEILDGVAESLSSGDESDIFMNDFTENLTPVSKAILDPSSPTKSALKSSLDTMEKSHVNLLRKCFDFKFSILRFLDSPNDIRLYTGLKDYSVFYHLYMFLHDDSLAMHYLGSKRKTQETEKGNKRGPIKKLIGSDEFFLTLLRLRKGYDEHLLGNLFGLSTSQVSRISNSWIMLMANRFGQFDLWPPAPPAESLLVPNYLKPEFNKCVVIVDCTEVFTEKPSATDAQKELFSTYKNHVTAKFLVGIDLNGTITFVSRAYAGRCSDKKIFMHCGILEKLKPGDIVMADRGFDLQKELESRGIKVLIPDFKNGRFQFTKAELKRSQDIALVRVHVERAIKFIKDFKILKGIIPITITPMLDDILICCSVLANFTGDGYLVKPKD